MNFRGMVLVSAIASIAVIGVLGIYHAHVVEQQDLEAQQRTLEPPELVFGGTDTDALPPTASEGTQQLKRLSSEEELRGFLASTQAASADRYGVQLDSTRFQLMDEAIFSSSSGRHTAHTDIPEVFPGYSSTNIQVAGVDEPDFLKTDGSYIYIVREGILTIVDAYPADEAEITVKVGLDVGRGDELDNMFLNKDRLVVFYRGHATEEIIPEYEHEPIQITTPVTHAVVLDVSDRERPKLLKDYRVDGDFMDARMIGDYVYFVSTMRADYHDPRVPRIVDATSTPPREIVPEPGVFYFDNPEYAYNLNTVAAINMLDTNLSNSETFLMGRTATIYVSQGSLYVTYEKNTPLLYRDSVQKDRFFDVVVPLLPGSVQDGIVRINIDPELDAGQKWIRVSNLLRDAYDKMSQLDKRLLFEAIEERLLEYDSKMIQDSRKTVIHRILLDGGNLQHQASGEVPGRLLNQFSMDEHGDRFRIATTNEFVSAERGRSQHNSVYVMDRDDLSMVGSVENLAQHESIFSARFMGDRLYLVTFETIDPFFVIDLSTDQPKVLGELKIPGFSNYLHPYDRDHVIGIGRDTKADSGWVQQLGVKLALFDVSDVQNPLVLDDVVIGGASTHSAALDSHKAFLFDRDRGVLSIPIEEYGDGEPWYGFYVYDLGTQDGFTLKGNIEHAESRHSHLPSGPRSLYIGDVLYTVSAHLIKMNDLDDVQNEINSIDLAPSGRMIEYLR